MKKIHPKMKVLEWSQHISHYKPMRMKKIQSKMKELEWSQHYSLMNNNE